MAVAAIIEELPEDHRLCLNPSGPVGMLVETEAVREAIAAAAG